jgi:hypothetical protein
MPVPTSKPTGGLPVNVLRIGDCLKVFGFDASLDPAEVVYVHPVWDGPHPKLIREAVSQGGCLTGQHQLAVSVSSDTSLPNQAITDFDDPLSKALFNISTGSTHAPHYIERSGV